jgi:carboxyl-terminal processing protease
MSWRNLYILLIAGFVSTACYLMYRQTRYALVVGNALNLIHDHYVDPVDDRKLLIAALDGMTRGLDPYSEFIPLEDYQRLQDTMKQEFAGIGIYVDQASPTEPVRVVTPLVGSPALQAGIKANDRIVGIDDESVVGMSLAEVSSRLKGPIGTEVRLKLDREGKEIQLQVRRDNIEIESVVGDQRDKENRWVFRLADHPEIGYARLTSFGDKTANELNDVLKQSQSVQGFILDLRSNGGGLLESAVEVCDQFLDSGRIVSTRIRGDRIESTHDASSGVNLPATIPVVILIDHQSASASEIVAAALQDHGRATIVGTRSFGKGTVQNVLPLEVGRSALKLTVAKYVRPNGQNIHRSAEAGEDATWGVSPNPDAIVEMDESQLALLIQRWQTAAFPHASIEDLIPKRIPAQETDNPESTSPESTNSESTSSETKSPTANATGADNEPKAIPVTPDTDFIDMQLKRAIEILKGQSNQDAQPAPETKQAA